MTEKSPKQKFIDAIIVCDADSYSIIPRDRLHIVSERIKVGVSKALTSNFQPSSYEEVENIMTLLNPNWVARLACVTLWLRLLKFHRDGYSETLTLTGHLITYLNRQVAKFEEDFQENP